MRGVTHCAEPPATGGRLGAADSGKDVAKLKHGQPLSLRAEPDNAVNSEAIILEAEGHQVGWVPNYLLDELKKA